MTVQELADLIHAESCSDTAGGQGCRRYKAEARHYVYYQDQAQNLLASLEPMIGASNVWPVIKIILDELG